MAALFKLLFAVHEFRLCALTDGVGSVQILPHLKV